MDIEERQKLEGGSLFSPFFHVFALVAAYFLLLILSLVFMIPAMSFYAIIWPMYVAMWSWKALIFCIVLVVLLHRQIERNLFKYFIILSFLGVFCFLITSELLVRAFLFGGTLKSAAFILGAPLAYSVLTFGIYIRILHWRIRRLGY